jgi:hypothetical protein
MYSGFVGAMYGIANVTGPLMGELHSVSLPNAGTLTSLYVL